MNGKANLNIWLLVWVLVLLLSGRAAVGGTITVGHEGPVDFRSIQAAINYANNGDEIMVLPGHRCQWYCGGLSCGAVCKP
ncbi:MAG: hypothetical protein ACYTDW_22675 [Planctomycetota bacterium]|jgi:hypothetical protein